MKKTLSVRDFIYLDVERLKSILSQIDEGLLEKVDKAAGSSGSGHLSAEANVPLLAKVGGAGTYVASSQVTETRTLHDHIYNYVEDKLLSAGALFVLNEELTASDWLDDSTRADVSPTAFVLVRGRAVVNDFHYMKSYLGQFNEVAAAIVRLSVADRAKALPEQQRKAFIAEQVAAMQLPKGQQEDLHKVLDAFVRNDLIVRIMPFQDELDARAVCNLDNPLALRVPLESLAFRFGSAPRDQWTLFGQTASVPLSGDKPFKFAASLGAEIDRSLQSVFNVLRDFEPLIASVVYPEICVVPIALYRG
jgi:hypothetical protein